MTDDLAKTHYDGTFFDAMEAGALSSAAAVLPIVLELIAPRSIVDVGWGAEHGCESAPNSACRTWRASTASMWIVGIC